MAYEYIAISKHPDNVITLSVGSEAEIYSHINCKGLLRQGLNPSPSGVLPRHESTEKDNTKINECSDQLDCSSPSGTIPADTTSEIESKLVENSRKDKQANSQRRSHQAIR